MIVNVTVTVTTKIIIIIVVMVIVTIVITIIITVGTGHPLQTSRAVTNARRHVLGTVEAVPVGCTPSSGAPPCLRRAAGRVGAKGAIPSTE